jgi:succinate-semialdehyde dehydrogenase/glutarate-semialdehyde dehydrogenase
MIATPTLPDVTAQVSDAVQRARAAQPRWAGLPVNERLTVIRGFQRKLYESVDEVAEIIAAETGKPKAEALTAEVVVTLDATRFLLKDVPNFLRDQRVPHGSLATRMKRGHLVREPHRVIGIISPWNYPFSIPASEVLAALACGNAVVLKPSEFTPRCALKLQELLFAAGLDRDLFHVVPGEGPVGTALVGSEINKLIFTGSVATGKRIAKVAAEKLLPVVLELGGKDPMLVLDDADIDIASSAAVWGAFMNAGQTCLSVERCYVDHKIYDSFVAACVEKISKLRIGEDVGPLISDRQLQIVEEQVKDAVAGGAKIVCGGARLAWPRSYAPTIVTNADHSMRLLTEETFGPVMPVISFASDDEAVRFANDSQFGLAASVWTGDRARGEALARRINAGTIMINDVLSSFGIPEAPHGGFGASGMGRTHGRLGLEEMVRTKYIDSDLLPRIAKVWWFGYGDAFYAQMRGFVDFLFSPSLAKRFKGGLLALKAFRRKNRI